MKKNNWVGIFLFVVFLMIEGKLVHAVEAFVLFSILVLIPLSFDFIEQRDRCRQKFLMGILVEWMYPIAAASAMLALVFNHIVFAGVWWGFTGLVALLGARRLLERGWRPIGESSIDIALMYLFLGGFWFFAYAADWEVAGFSGIIVLLTAIHFHYSAYFLPIFVGLVNRKVQVGAMTFIVMISPMTVAIGITYSTTIELMAVSVYLVALFTYSYRIWTISFVEKSAKWLLRVSASFLLLTITFSLLYAFGTFRGKIILTIGEMIWIHGAANAFMVILLGVVGWRIEFPQIEGDFYGKPMSKVKGSFVVGGQLLKKKNLETTKVYTGVVDDMKVFSSKDLTIDQLAPTIVDFYEDTLSYELKAKISWKTWFVPVAYMYQLISRRMQQIYLGMGKKWEGMSGEIVGIDSDMDGRENVRAWVRKNVKGETIFVALYSIHSYKNETYMNISLPLPQSNMTGILKPLIINSELILTSRRRKQDFGDEGIYLSTSLFKIRLPLNETFVLKEKAPGKLLANHDMWIFGMKFLHIEYDISKKELSHS
jgi:hypothetical protein